MRMMRQLLIQANVRDGPLGQLRLAVSGLPDFLSLLPGNMDPGAAERGVAEVLKTTGGDAVEMETVDGGGDAVEVENGVDAENTEVEVEQALGLDGVDERTMLDEVDRTGKLPTAFIMESTAPTRTTTAKHATTTATAKHTAATGKHRTIGNGAENMYDVLSLVDA